MKIVKEMEMLLGEIEKMDKKEVYLQMVIRKGKVAVENADLVQNDLLVTHSNALVAHAYFTLPRSNEYESDKKLLDLANHHYGAYRKAIANLASSNDGEPSDPWNVRARIEVDEIKGQIEKNELKNMTLDE